MRVLNASRVVAVVVVWCCVASALFAPSALSAQGFPMMGPRNLAMGASGVASVADASAVFVNPAVLGRNTRTRLAIPMVGVTAFSPVDVDETADIIDAITTTDVMDPNAAENVANLIRQLDDDLALGYDAHGLVAVALPGGFAISYSERVFGDLYIDVDRQRLSTIVTSPDFVGNNQTSGVSQFTRLSQIGLSYGLAIGEHVLVGATLLGGQATNYRLNETIFSLALKSADREIDWRDEIRSNKQRSYFVDGVAGVQVRLFDGKLTLAGTGNNLLSPKIERKNLSDFRLDPQARVGVAWSPCFQPERRREIEEEEADEDGERRSRTEILYESNPLTFTVDYDLTVNQSGLRNGIDRRHLGGGVEFAAAPWLAIRAGIYANLEKTSLGQVITGGLQISALELAAAYSTKRSGDYANEMSASLGLAITF